MFTNYFLKEKTQIKTLAWFVLIIEGSALMATELVSAKLLAPFYGNSLYIWTGTLSCTLIGLSLGYFIGGKLSKIASIHKLVTIALFAGLLIQFLPNFCSFIIPKTFNLPIKEGSFIACLLIITPPIMLLGSIGPIAIQLLATNKTIPGMIAGKAFFISTISGAISIFGYAFYLIPKKGLTFSTSTIAVSISLIGILYLFYQLRQKAYEKE